MAEFGANHPCFQPGTSTGIVLGKLVSANLTVTNVSGEIYADDGLAEQISEFSSGAIAMETDDLTDEKASVVYGASVQDNELIYNKNDAAPFGGLAYYKALMRGGVKYYKGYYYPKVKAATGNDNATTRGSTITFQSTATAFTVFADDNGDWRINQTFNDEASAKAWCESKCNVGTYYAVNVNVQGAGEGEGVDTIGKLYVPAGTNFTLNIEGYEGVSAAYDNGKDVTLAITSGTGKYTITSIAADHSIAIVF